MRPAEFAPQRIDEDQQLHQIVVGGRRGGLDQENVLAAHALVQAHEGVGVGEAEHVGAAQRHSQVLGDLLRQRGVRRAAVDRQVAVQLVNGRGRPNSPFGQGMVGAVFNHRWMRLWFGHQCAYWLASRGSSLGHWLTFSYCSDRMAGSSRSAALYGSNSRLATSATNWWRWSPGTRLFSRRNTLACKM